MECGQQRVMKQEMSFGFGQGLFKRFRPEDTVAVEEIDVGVGSGERFFGTKTQSVRF